MDQEQQQQQYQVMQVIGAIKIKDGLFIGDEFASKDLEFIITNKVTHIINCSGQQIQNSWENIGVQYLTFPWMENDHQILFDDNDENLNEIFNFIEESVEQGESTLVHSVRGQSRSCCVLAAYLMKKFKWTLYKTLEFLNTRRPDLEIRASFFHQLTALEQKLYRQGEGAKSASWQELSDESGRIESEELLVRNTFLNARNAPIADIFSDPQANLKALNKDIRAKLRWKDNGLNDRTKLNYEEIPYENFEIDIKNGKKNGQKKTFVKSCLKGSGRIIRLQQNNQSVSNNDLEASQKENLSLRSSIKGSIAGNSTNNLNVTNTNQISSNQIPANNSQKQTNVLQYQQNIQQQLSPSPYNQQQSNQSSNQQQQQLQLSKKPLTTSNQQPKIQNNANNQLSQQVQQVATLKHNKSAKSILEDSNQKDNSFLDSQSQQQNYGGLSQQQQQQQQQQSSSFILTEQKPPTNSKITPPLSQASQLNKDLSKQTPPLKNTSQSIKVTSAQNNGQTQKQQILQSGNNSSLSGLSYNSSFNAQQQLSSKNIQIPAQSTQQQQQQQQQQYNFNQINSGSKSIHRSSSLSNFDKEKENQQNGASGISQLNPQINQLHLSLERPMTSQNSASATNQNNLKVSSNGKPYQFLSPNNNAFSQNQSQINFSNSVSSNMGLNKNQSISSSMQQQIQQGSLKKDIPSPISAAKQEDLKNKQRSYTTSGVINNNQSSSSKLQNDNSILGLSSNKSKLNGQVSPLPLPQAQTPSSANQHQYRSNSVPKRIEESQNNTSTIQNSTLYSTSSGFNNQNNQLNQNKRPQSASAKDKKDSNFSSSSSQQIPNNNNPSSQRFTSPYTYQPLSNKNQQFNQQIDTKVSSFNSKKDLLNGISPNNHNQLINPNKPYQRGESPSIKQKEKMQKQHQLKLQQQQQQQQQIQQQQQSQQKRNTYIHSNAPTYQNYSLRQNNQSASNPLPPPSGIKQSNDQVNNENQIYSQQVQGSQQNLNSLSQNYMNIISAKKPPTSGVQKDQIQLSNNQNQISLVQNQSSANNILREQDSNKMTNQNVQEQVNQINQISNNLMKTLLHFQPQSTTNQSNSNNISIKNTGNSSGFMKQSGGPVRVTGDILQNSFKQSNNTSSGQQLLLNNYMQEENNSSVYKLNQPSTLGNNNKQQLPQMNQQVSSQYMQQNINVRGNSAPRSFSPSVKGIANQNNNSSSKQNFENQMLINQSQQQQNQIYQPQYSQQFQQPSIQQLQQQQLEYRQRLRSNSPGQNQVAPNMNNNYNNSVNVMVNNNNISNIVAYNNIAVPQPYDSSLPNSANLASLSKPKWKF
ncbi:dual specificity phosphatase domain protein (macronuclear) [Tetrahymena thermophila SB210]|uniref:Dual specificity phosphatase domain protein n=1 Tax=Tetrahymena thermophila (strain SB210) TaxID=312017 RepID=Q24FC7_TETTS|nr:dual specificity phosphatase domain protein [Tetrahymena thermophila SB210]EAS06531.2 dual specificity phosphatase domain protein [Tetrahymena thermophila SB210]|eukprot:XP_001026776.2 dual specificity phosphatase domain protein [Tetrahymena thermophila SB210]